MDGSKIIRTLLALTLAWSLRPGSAVAQTIPATQAAAASSEPTSPAAIAAARDEADRITVPVMINDKGPFPFVVDTGADRTVISKELAADLALPPGPPAMLSATSGVELEQTGAVQTLKVGRRTIADVNAPLLDRTNLGAKGMLGIDGLRGQAVVLDFRRKRITVATSKREYESPGVIVVHAKSRYGQLILVDAHIGRLPVYVILDSGAQNTVANTTLGRMLALRSRPAGPVTPSISSASPAGIPWASS